ncbi:MAG: hypothetical protein LBI02_00940, partial [Opitutaceae bacterium]|nr:hypothetical protein [Opitutaceae bacterium]
MPDNTAAVAADLAKTMPEVTVQPPASGGAAAPGNTPAFPPDAVKRAWDSTRFRANPDGTPRLDTLGRFVSLKCGRRKAGVSAGGSYIPPEPKTPAPAAPGGARDGGPGGAEGVAGGSVETAPPPPPAPTNTAAAEVLTRGLYTATGAITGVPEEATPKPGDHENLKTVMASALDAWGLRVGVGLGLVVGFLGYVLMVLNSPKTRKALAAKLEDWRAARAKRVTPPGAAPASAPATQTAPLSAPKTRAPGQPVPTPRAPADAAPLRIEARPASAAA